MKNTTHRVVILKNVNSAMISQAILILKDSAIENDSNLIMEAERIVEKYMNSGLPMKKADNGAKIKAGLLSAGVMLIGLGLFIAFKLL